MQHQIKVVGNNGQISLGKQFAGKTVAIDQVSSGTWTIRCGEFIPQEERWVYQELTKLEKALDWAKTTMPVDNFEQLAKQIENDAS